MKLRKCRAIVQQVGQGFEMLKLVCRKELLVPDDKEKFLSSRQGHINTVDIRQKSNVSFWRLVAAQSYPRGRARVSFVVIRMVPIKIRGVMSCTFN